MKSDDPVSEALSEVVDPEMGISVTELGLIYGIERKEGHVEVTMTLTSPGARWPQRLWLRFTGRLCRLKMLNQCTSI